LRTVRGAATTSSPKPLSSASPRLRLKAAPALAWLSVRLGVVGRSDALAKNNHGRAYQPTEVKALAMKAPTLAGAYGELGRNDA